MRNWISVVPMALALFITACATDQGTESSKVTHQTAPPLVQYGGKEAVSISPFRSDAPNTYVVRRGDSLWSIAGKFLNNPGRWKEIWYANSELKNPNRIYPGDVLAIKSVAGKKRVYVKTRTSNVGQFTGTRTSKGLKIYNVKPTVVNEPLNVPVPTFPVSALAPFVDRTMVINSGFDNEMGYIVGDSSNSYLSLTSRKLVYAKGEFEQDSYLVYRRGEAIKDPFDQSVIGHEGDYVGEVLMVRLPNDDGIGTFKQVEQYRPLMPNDVLLAKEAVQPGGALEVMPSLYSGDSSFYVIKSMGRNFTGTQFNTLLVKGGKDDGLEVGQVFSIVRGTTPEGVGRDGESLTLPDYEIGMGMVYKTLDDISYLLVMNAEDAIYPKDRLIIPPK